MTQLLIQTESHWFRHFADFILTGFGLHLYRTLHDKYHPVCFHSDALFPSSKLNICDIVSAFFIGTESKMKLWDVLATCLLLLSSAVARPLHQNTPPAKRTYFPSSSSDSSWLSTEDEAQTFQREKHSLQELSMEDQCKNRCPTASRSWPLDLNKPGRCYS